MNIDFYFDPVCPWCWMTSRWIKMVEDERNLSITWKPISLLVKNGPDGDYGPYYEMTAQMLDVVETVRDSGQVDKIDALYTAFGTSVHRDRSIAADNADVNAIIRGCLKEAGLDESLADAAGADKYRKKVIASTNEAIGLAGEDVGTPIIAFESSNGSEVGLFGPVISELPENTQEATKQWDAFVTIAQNPHIWELKRTRTEDANTASTFK